MPAMSVGGLASGLDTNSIISQLTALEQTKVTREAKKKEAAQSTLDKFKELQTRLGTLQSKASGLRLPTNFNMFAATSNYPEYAQIKGGEGATAGQYEVTVNQLATTQKVASKSFKAVNTALDGNNGGTITLSTSIAAQKKDPTKKTVDVKIEKSDTLKDIVSKINAAEGTGVRASLMTMANGENRLVLTAVDTGTNGFFIKESTGGNLLTNVLGILDDENQKVKSANAFVTKEGFAATEETTFDDLNSVFKEDNFASGDKIGIYLPVIHTGSNNSTSEPGWVAFDLYEDGVSKTIGEVLKEINDALLTAGATGITASLNSSGEIVLEGSFKDADSNEDKNFGNSANLAKVKIQIISPTALADKDLEAEDFAAKLNAINTNTVNRDTFLDKYYDDSTENANIKAAADTAADTAAVNAVIAAAQKANVYDPDTFDINNFLSDPSYKKVYDEEYGKIYNDEINKSILTAMGRNGDTLTITERDSIVKEEIQKEIDKQQQAMFTVKKDMGKLSSANVFKNVISEAQNAFYTVDGMGVSSQSNEDDKLISGTTFVLLKADKDKTVKVSLELDQNALVEKIAGFVEEFNALLRFIDENTKVTTKEEENPATGRKQNTRVTGPFSGDSAISSLRDQLKAMMTSTIDQIAKGLKDDDTDRYSTPYSSASRLGIVTNREGYLDVDRDKLNKALTADFEGVRRLFTANSFSDTNGFRVGNFGKDAQAGVYEVYATGKVFLNGKEVELSGSSYGNILTTKDGLSFEIPSSNIKFDSEGNPYEAPARVTFVRGIADQMSNFVEKAKALTNTLSNGKIVPGFFKQTEKTYEDRIKSIQERIDVLQIRVDNYSMRITNQFNALERSMSTLQSQTSNMMSALSSMNYNRR
jgi:flagellar capping protein FliD